MLSAGEVLLVGRGGSGGEVPLGMLWSAAGCYKNSYIRAIRSFDSKEILALVLASKDLTLRRTLEIAVGDV